MVFPAKIKLFIRSTKVIDYFIKITSKATNLTLLHANFSLLKLIDDNGDLNFNYPWNLYRDWMIITLTVVRFIYKAHTAYITYCSFALRMQIKINIL
jgi:hypothetical protein